MSLLQYSIKNMIGGVSQQPASVRLQNQCSEMINCTPSVSEFLKRRQGTTHIKQIFNSLPSNSFIDFIIRGENDAGILVISNGTAYTFNLKGNLLGSTSHPYLECDNPKDKLRLLTIKDYNFILNIDKKITGKLNTVANRDIGFAFVKQAAYNTKYTITVNDREYSYTTPKTDSSGYKLSTELIADRLAEKIRRGISGAAEGIYYCEMSHGSEYYEFSTQFIALERCSHTLTVDGKVTTCNNSFRLIKYSDGGNIYNVNEGVVDMSFGVTSYKSIIAIMKKSTGDLNVEVSDGMSGAYFKWIGKTVQSFSELPLIAPNNQVVEIAGDPATINDNYYVKFKTDTGSSIGNGSWVETSEKGEEYSIDSSTMPHALIINLNNIEIKTPEWKNRIVGNDISCPVPSFVNTKIKDIFFYRNRLCFLTEDTLCMSESGEFFNFFNTTATALLDSDPIDVSISSTKISALKYALPYNEGLFLYSDTTLFIAEHSDILSTSSISIRPLIQFDTEITARPVVMDMSIFYVTNRGEYSALREYEPNTSGDLYGYSNEITSHIPTYIPKNLRKISFCMEERVLFAITGKDNTIYVYNYFNGTGRERLQSAWGKWVFNCKTVIHIEVIKGTLYLLMEYNDGQYLEKIDLGDDSLKLKDRQGHPTLETDFESVYTYSNQYIRWDSASPTVTGGRVQLKTLCVKYAPGNPFKVVIDRVGRKTEERIVNNNNSDESRVAVLAQNKDVNLRIKSLGEGQFRLIESRLEAEFTTRSKLI